MKHSKDVRSALLRSCIGLAALMPIAAFGQLTVSPQGNLQELAEAISGTGVQISNPSITCHAQGYGEFAYTGSLLGLESGVILSSGRISEAIGPNDVENKSFQQGTPGSSLLNTVTGRTTYDACRFEFDIIPSGDSLSFQFVFGSEEYNEWVGSQYNDVFGFFISGPGITGDPGIGADRNIALIPGSNSAVAINNVNAGQNSQYYAYNAGGQQLQMDGYTRNLVARSAVQPCQTYRLKLIVADASDRKFDSWVFIERIQSPGITLSTRTLNGTPHMVEGCNPGWIRFTRDPVRPTPLTLQYYLQGTATNGVDYTAIGNTDPSVAKTIVIPANEAFAEQPVIPSADGIAEPIEHLKVVLGNPLCPGSMSDSIEFAIADTLIATVSPTGVQTICHGSSTQFNIQGGLTYAWTPATGLSCTDCPNPIASPTVNTTYTVVINEGTCVRTVSRLVRVSNTSVSGIVTQPLCDGSANGAINITASGGYAPYTFAWTGPNGFAANTEDLVGIGAGTYTVTVTDAFGCARTQSFNLGSPAPLSISLTPSILPFGQNIACHGASTGTLTLAISGGTGPFNVQWSGPNGFSSTSQNLSGIAAGTYTVAVTDGNGCTASSSFTMTQSAPLEAIISGSQEVSCFGGANGEATASASGGMPPYSYAWDTSPVQTSATATNLQAGTRTVTVTDGYGCMATASVSIVQPSAPLTVALTGVNPILHCQGQSQQHGTATANASGGTGPYSYSWNTTPVQNSASATFISGGTYTVTATDSRGCTGSTMVTVNQPGNIVSAIMAQTNVNCFGASTGSATVSITGGSNIQSLTWNTMPVQSGPFATNLPAGTWTLTAQHADGCVTQVPVTITQPAAALGSTIDALTHVSCFGGSTGSATVSATGGTGPYTYSWNTTPVQTSATASNLPAGTFTCTIADANGCTTSRNVTITQPAENLGSTIAAQTNVSCHGGTTGSATVSATGGTGPYTYSWNTTPVQNGATASNLSAGTFTCTIADANGCTTSRNVTITQPAENLGSTIAAQTNVSCHGGTTGSATVSATGGTGPYTYSWNTTPVQNGATASNLPAGTFTCTIADANGCTTTRNVTITQPPAALSSTIAAQTNVSCFGGNTGSATVSATGGTGPYTYSWNTTPVQNGATASNLPAGTFTCTIADANGCTTTRNVTITQPPAALSSTIAAQTNVSCFGGNTGSATVSATGGTGPYTYTWNTSPVQNGATASNLPAGTFTCTIADANGCTTSRNVTITQPAENLGSTIAAQINVSCHGGYTGSTTVSATGGTGPYTYSWNTIPVQTSATASNLPAGTFTCTIADANGCTTTRNVTITQPAAALSSTIAAQTNVSCFGENTGSATVSATGGTGPYTYSWNTSPVQNGATASNLPAGTFTCTIADANGCTTTRNVTITQPAENLSSTIAAQTNVSCHGGTTGSASVSATGGTGPYIYTWNTSPVQNGATASNLPAGTFTCTIADANGCTTTRNVTITQPAAGLAISGTISSATCGGANDGSIDATISGGTGSYSTSWSGPNGFTSSTTDISGLASGAYLLSVTDANGCSASQAFNVSQPGLFTISAIISDHNGFGVSCDGGSDGSISISANGGTGPYTHAWTGPNGFSASTQSISAVAPGTYTYTITDANGCSAAESYTLSAPAPISISITAATVAGGWNIGCNGSATGSIDAAIDGGSAPYAMAWSGPGGFSSGNEDISGLVAGAYTLAITDGNGCAASASINLTQPATLTGSTDSIAGISCSGASDGVLSISATGGTAPYSFLWSTSPAQSGPVAIGLGEGIHECTITDANGCAASVQTQVIGPPALTVAITGTTDVLCHDGIGGSAQSQASGGTEPYQYTWSTAPAQSGAAAIGLARGTYTVTVVDANGCMATADATIGGPENGIWAVTESVSPVSCFGLSDGSATLDVTGGSGSYTITWNTLPPQSGLTATGLAAGSYLALVVDNNGCDHEKWVPVQIDGPAAPLNVQLDITPITCAGANNGTVDLTMSGGMGPYTHVWSDDFGTSTGAQDLTGLDPGTYYLHAFDAYGCVIDTSFVLTQPLPLAVSSAISPTACLGEATGAINLTVGGGTAPYTHVWSGPGGFTAVTEDLSGLSAGNYIAIVMDANGCQHVSSHAVTQPAGIDAIAVLSSYNGSGTSCDGAADGSISLSVLGGSGTYSFAWSGPNGFSANTSSISGLTAGTYGVTITDGNGCALQQSHTLSAPAPLQASGTPSSFNGYGISCAGAQDGAIDLGITGGTAPFSITWSGPNGFSAATEDISALAPGTYEAQVVDANGCSISTAMMIIEPPALSATAAAFTWPGGTSISCAAATDGAIDLAVTGGTQPYAISWSNGLGYSAVTEDIEGLEPGGYLATITDDNGCVATAFAMLSAPEPITISAAVAVMNGSNVSCAGAEDGSIDLTVLGGTAPYLIAWSNGATTEDLASIGAGTYTVQVSDANGCQAAATYVISGPALLDVDLHAEVLPGGSNTSCHGAADGSIEALIAGGTLPHVLNWSGPDGFSSSSASISGLGAGTYTLHITDANGCEAMASIAIDEPSPVTAQISASLFGGNYNIPCAGSSIGSASASASGGTPGYSLSWTGPGVTGITGNAVSGLAAGAYTVSVTDANGCTGSASVELLEPPVLEAQINITDLGGYPVSCAGNDGSASVAVSGGTAPYFISWTGPNGFASTEGALSGLSAGSYQLTVLDANGCTRQETIELTAPQPLAATFASVLNSCPGEQAGSIDASITGGSAPYVFVWSGPDGFSSNDEDPTNLASGVYLLSVTDAIGCTGQFSTQLSGPAPMNSGTYVSFFGLYNLQCLGDSSGVIELAPLGGTAPYAVAIAGPDGFVSNSLNNQGLIAGDYQVTITDANGCAMDTLITLSQPDTEVAAALTTSLYPSGTNVSCFGASDGWIDATVTGGSGPYSFDWRGPDSLAFSSEDIYGLPAGTYAYELVVIDANQCAFSTTVTLTQPDTALFAEAVLSGYNGFAVSCPGADDGSIDLDLGGGNGGYALSWIGPNGFSASSEDLSGLTAGTYTVTVTDMNGCTLTQPYALAEPSPIEAVLNPSDYHGSGISCAGQSDGAITAVIIGGAGGFNLAWSGPDGFSSSSAQIDGLAAGAYCLSITDANGCAAQSCVTITAPEALAASISAAAASCGEANGSLAVAVTGGTAPFGFAWSNGSSAASIDGLTAGTYEVLVTDANGCTVTTSGVIRSTPAVSAAAVTTDVLCSGALTGGIDLTLLSGTPPFSVIWSNGSSDEDLMGVAGGAYSATVTDAAGCAWSGSWTIAEAEAIALAVSVSSHSGGYAISTAGGSDGSVSVAASGGAEPYAFLWSNGSTASSLSGLPAGTYTVTVTDANGCSITRAITLEAPDDLVMPTGFTPNGDGHNDLFIVRGLDAYPSNLLTVLNRWGNVVCERLNYKNDWAGENSQGDALPNGTYFVILSINNGQRSLQGYVDLRR